MHSFHHCTLLLWSVCGPTMLALVGIWKNILQTCCKHFCRPSYLKGGMLWMPSSPTLRGTLEKQHGCWELCQPYMSIFSKQNEDRCHSMAEVLHLHIFSEVVYWTDRQTVLLFRTYDQSARWYTELTSHNQVFRNLVAVSTRLCGKKKCQPPLFKSCTCYCRYSYIKPCSLTTCLLGDDLLVSWLPLRQRWTVVWPSLVMNVTLLCCMLGCSTCLHLPYQENTKVLTNTWASEQLISIKMNRQDVRPTKSQPQHLAHSQY
jgi:hypothetical protein